MGRGAGEVRYGPYACMPPPRLYYMCPPRPAPPTPLAYMPPPRPPWPKCPPPSFAYAMPACTRPSRLHPAITCKHTPAA